MLKRKINLLDLIVGAACVTVLFAGKLDAASCALRTSSWISSETPDDSVVDRLGQNLETLYVYAYWFDSSGNIVPSSSTVDARLAQYEADNQGGRRPVFVTVQNHIQGSTSPIFTDGELVDGILSDPGKRAAHIQQLVALSAKADGVEIDYENLLAKTRPSYSQFIQELRTALPPGKKIACMLQAKTTEKVGNFGEAIDWKAIQPFVDNMQVLAYYYSNADTSPGPVVTKDQIRAQINFAFNDVDQKVDRTKLHLAFSLRGWDWPAGKQGTQLDLKQALALAQAHNVTPIRDPINSDLHFTYTDNGGVLHTVFVDDMQSVSEKVLLAQSLNVAHIDYWHLGVGDTDSLQWFADHAANLPEPQPLITSLNPSSAVAGSPAFTLNVNASNLTCDAVVLWNGSFRPTTVSTGPFLTAAISSADIASPGVDLVAVENAVSVSSPAIFTVIAPSSAPVLLSLHPAEITAGSGNFTLSVTGRNFNPFSVIRWNGSNRPTVFVSSATLTAAIPGADIVTPGTVPITVATPPPGGGVSNALPFTIAPLILRSLAGLSAFRVFPNPWSADKHSGSPMTFDHLPNDSTIKLFTVSGRWIKTLPAPGGSVTWDLTNDQGESVASGYYLFLIDDGQGNTVHGKIAIVR